MCTMLSTKNARILSRIAQNRKRSSGDKIKEPVELSYDSFTAFFITSLKETLKRELGSKIRSLYPVLEELEKEMNRGGEGSERFRELLTQVYLSIDGQSDEEAAV